MELAATTDQESLEAGAGRGYFGGGGGEGGDSSNGAGGGGGGSSFTAPGATGVVHTQGSNAGAGSVTISW